ncbi:disease resistance TIR-NBS-LRR class family protein [Tanacetum coccineum]|uniref:Disease resistance TIR-NBS-LRR class family protein n=1 Tax=Tanacetum coccineum TaxID=301880 RepID=A0ABQ5GZ83_9ASTR
MVSTSTSSIHESFDYLKMSPNQRLRFKKQIDELIQQELSSSASSNARLRLSDPSSITPGASTSNSSFPKSFKYDVFLSFRGEDTRKNFVDHLYHALKQKGIYTYKDDEKIHKGKRISDDLFKSIQDSKFYIIVFSKNYASSSWCLEELVKIMECHKMTGHTAYPVFYDVEPTQVRKQTGAVGEAFAKHENEEGAVKWKGALKEAADLAGWELKNTLDGHEAKFINKIVQEISLELRSINFSFDEKLVGMESRVKDVVSSLEIGIDEVRMIGIKGMGGAGKTTTARAVFDHLSISNDFEAKSFVENVREVSSGSISGLKKLQEQVLSKVLNEHVTLDSVNDGRNMMKRRMCGIKVLLVLDDVDHIDQLEALAGGPNWFKPGSRIIVTTRDEQVLVGHRVNLIQDIHLLSEKEAICLFSRYAFGRELPSKGYEELSEKVVSYASGLPLTIKVLGSFLCGKDRVEWVDAIKRLEKIPLKETLEKLELSYISLEDEYKEIFLDIACILKGEDIEYAIRILESCGFHARIGLKVLEQRSLITIISSKYDQVLGMHDHIEEMGKNIVRREHPDDPNKHSRLWKYEEIEDILANDVGTEETRCLRLDMYGGNSRNLMKGLGKMKKLRYLEVEFPLGYLYSHSSQLDESTQYFPNSLKYLTFKNYPFLYLPKTFEANNLVGLEMIYSGRMVQLWEEGEKKVFNKLKFIYLERSYLTTFDFRITPNLEMLTLDDSLNLKELCMQASCQKLNYLCISNSNLTTFDLGLTPNLQTLSLFNCTHFVKLHVSVACPNLKILTLSRSRLRSLDLELIPNLESLDLSECHELVEMNAPVGCLKQVGYLNLSGCLRFTKFVFGGSREPFVNCSSANLALVGESLDLCPLHPNSNLPKLRFCCDYKQDQPSSVGIIEKLMSFGLCACTDLKKFSDMICCFQRLRGLLLECNIPEFPKDLGQLECLEELCLSSTKIKHLPDSICMLKRLKYLGVNDGDLLEKLPEDIDKLECLEELSLSSTKIKHLPDSICMLKRLESLKVSNGDLLEKLPEDLGQLECLEELYVRSKKIEYLPDSIFMLKRLKSLNVSECCHLGKLPEDIGQLESLEKLDLSATMIKHLPDSICMLKHMKHLNLERCAHLEKLPEDLGLLKCLKELVITDTGISHLPQSIFGLKGLHIAASSEILQLYVFPSEIKTTTFHFRCKNFKRMLDGTYIRQIVPLGLDSLMQLDLPVVDVKNDVSDILDLTFSMDADEEKQILLRNLSANRGFNELIPRDLISIFNDKELELLISGLPEIDLDDLKVNTEYTGYTVGTNVVIWFWEVVKAFNKEDSARLLQFVTGTSKECGKDGIKIVNQEINSDESLQRGSGDDMSKNRETVDEILSQNSVESFNVSHKPAVNNVEHDNVNSTFASVLNNWLDNKLCLIPTEIGTDGVEVVIFDDEIVKEGSKKWELTVCGYFVGYSMSFQELSYNLYKMWGKYGLKHIMPNGNGVFLFKFKNEEGIRNVIENGPWMVNGKPMFVQKWDPTVCLDKAEPKKLPVWVKFRKLPLEAWSTKGLSAIASRLGTPLIMDQITTQMCNLGNGRVGFARVLIEVEACKGLPDQVEIIYKNKENEITGKKRVKVDYDWKPPMCSYCSVFGHKVEKCGCRPRTEKEKEEEKKEEERKKEEAAKNEKDGFIQVNRKKPSYNTNYSRKNTGNVQGNGKNNVIYKPIVKEKSQKEVGVESSNQNTKEQRPEDVVNGSPNERTKWNVNKEVIDNIKRSANKFSVLRDDPGDEETSDEENKANEEEEDVLVDLDSSASKTTRNEFKIATWNIRGLGKLSKQNVVRNLMRDENLSVCAILETRLKGQKVSKIGTKVFGRWEWIDNANECSRGCRIMVGWDNSRVHCMLIHASDQAMLCLIEILSTKEKLMCTFIHAETLGRLRKTLWADLSNYKSICNNNPWVLMEDINVSLNFEDHSEGISYKSQDMEEFQDCVNRLKIDDVAFYLDQKLTESQF